MLNYMQTPPTHYYLEFSGQVAYMETHLKDFTGFRAINSRTSMLYNMRIAITTMFTFNTMCWKLIQVRNCDPMCFMCGLNIKVAYKANKKLLKSKCKVMKIFTF